MAVQILRGGLIVVRVVARHVVLPRWRHEPIQRHRPMAVHPIRLHQCRQRRQTDADLGQIGQPAVVLLPREIHRPAVAQEMFLLILIDIAAAAEVDAVAEQTHDADEKQHRLATAPLIPMAQPRDQPCQQRRYGGVFQVDGRRIGWRGGFRHGILAGLSSKRLARHIVTRNGHARKGVGPRNIRPARELFPTANRLTIV